VAEVYKGYWLQRLLDQLQGGERVGVVTMAKKDRQF